MEVSRLDPASFLFFDAKSTRMSKERKLSGMISTHVDDSLTVGKDSFRNQVEVPIMEKFKYGSHEGLPFRYVGFNVERSKEGLTLDQNHYVSNLCETDVTLDANLLLDDLLDEEGQGNFRSIAAKLSMLSVPSRPDIAFDSKIMTTKFGKAVKRDLKQALKLLKKVKQESTKMIYPCLGKLIDWIIIGYADASVYSMPDRIGSVGGQVIILANRKLDRACVLGWRSKQLRRVVHSSLAAEALAMLDLFGDIKYTRDMLQQMYGTHAHQISTIAVSDSKNLWQAVHSLKSVDD